eukprot:CAMPEP_0201880304 /NCGR_PEP_ID=MMETSP0902-20130614/10926_1 /ASSEMBLY_ACC=CAM_ASM_000551 /TAXON_ID=420261 /ORGANISM="Thalassiosira antarctica, Strain CCMP982" /LENGTH=127 /DNA_ID=CAMNT_0048408289 /DNA_START=270 /DNA_END=654 /DNA_ORIENTATION=+
MSPKSTLSVALELHPPPVPISTNNLSLSYLDPLITYHRVDSLDDDNNDNALQLQSLGSLSLSQRLCTVFAVVTHFFLLTSYLDHWPSQLSTAAYSMGKITQMWARVLCLRESGSERKCIIIRGGRGD